MSKPATDAAPPADIYKKAGKDKSMQIETYDKTNLLMKQPKQKLWFHNPHRSALFLNAGRHGNWLTKKKSETSLELFVEENSFLSTFWKVRLVQFI